MNPVVRQLEYYVSDVNLQGDEFTRNLLAQHNNLVSLEVFNTTFKKMKEFNLPLDKLTKIINEHSKHLHINEKGEVVLNRPPRAEPVSAVLQLSQHPFKYPGVVSYKKHENGYLCYFYEQSEADELLQATAANTATAAPSTKTYVAGLILKVTNVPTGTKRTEFYKIFEQFGEIRFVDYYDDKDYACVRFRESSPDAVPKAVAHFAEQELVIADNHCKVEPVEGDEEKAIWDRILNPKPTSGPKRGGRKFK